MAVAALMVGLVACGGNDDEPDASSSTPTESETQTDLPNLEPFLMQDGEEPGFVQGALPDAMPEELQTFTGVDAFAAVMRLPSADATRLTEEGFLAYTQVPIRGPKETAGVSNVALYETAEGAQHSLANDLQPGVIRGSGSWSGLEFFDVPGVPGARGYKASAPHVANVLWVQGRCYFVLGNAGPGDLVGRLSAGVKAIYERTNGQCP